VSTLISVDELASLLNTRPAVGDSPVVPELVLLDVRWILGRTDGDVAFADGHIPGAVYVDLDAELAGPAGAGAGRHPLPTASDFEAAARSWGVSAGTEVVVYDAAHSFSASRAWWLLRNAGLDSVRVLDGGLRAWVTGGHPVEQGTGVRPDNGTLEVRWGSLPTVDIDEAAAFPAAGRLLDARAGERFTGEQEPIDPRAGHVPGAVSAPTTGNLRRDGSFLPASELRERFAGLDIDSETSVAVYCGSGITASHQILALEVAGISASLFPGSWSQWSNDAARPVAVGLD